MALEVREYKNRVRFGSKQLLFRIGVNSASVVAGVVGHKKFIYDLWRDAVNTASRMESHGARGEIHVTKATRDLIEHDFICEPRGLIDVKGKGEMEIRHVVTPASV